MREREREINRERERKGEVYGGRRTGGLRERGKETFDERK